MLIGITKPGSKVCSLSQIKLMKTDDGPLTPSLSRRLRSVKLREPGWMDTGLSDSWRWSAIVPPGLGSPCTRTRPIVDPIGRSSDTKKLSDEAPFSK